MAPLESRCSGRMMVHSKEDVVSQGFELWGASPGLPSPDPKQTDLSFFSAALKASPSKKGRSALLGIKPSGPMAAFSASQIPSEKEETQYDLRGARSYPTLDDEGSVPHPPFLKPDPQSFWTLLKIALPNPAPFQ